MTTEKPDVQGVLAGLKDFQRRTVDYVFERLYGADPVSKYLVADEVGLGKTLVARGVIARAIEHLWGKDQRRIDIIYICANRDIAAQNIGRLNITKERERAFASRLTLLPLHLEKLDERLNFVSFTPGTSFDLHSKLGTVAERALIYRILKDAWGFSGAAPRNLFQGDCSPDTWSWQREQVQSEHINEALLGDFIASLKQSGDKEKFEKLLGSFQRRRDSRGNLPEGVRCEQRDFIGGLRRQLAGACLKKLEPDIIIMDEFQRFKNLMDEEDEVGQLAKDLFSYEEAKVLLLSATPYKMYTMAHEAENDHHYDDFLGTVEFLSGGKKGAAAFTSSLEEYRQALLALDGRGAEALRSAKVRVESHLRRVMVRTERLAVSVDRDGMVREQGLDRCSLDAPDVRAYGLTDKIAGAYDSHDPVEYWKSAPYLLNLMDKSTYQLKKKFVADVESGRLKKKTADALREGVDSLLPWGKIKKYESIAQANAKLRLLMEETVDQAAWRLLWVPPSLPYYAPASGPWASEKLKKFTKALVFSSWRVVPKVIAALGSYEAERRTMSSVPGFEYPEISKQRRPLILFPVKDGIPAGMNALTLLYPCFRLAECIDPAVISTALAMNGQPPSIDAVFEAARKQVSVLVEEMKSKYQAKSSKESVGAEHPHAWYSAALALLDREHQWDPEEKWWDASREGGTWESMVLTRRGEGESRFDEHVKAFRGMFDGERRFQAPPDDFISVLTKVALASPAVVALRALLRLANERQREHHAGDLMAAAAKIAIGFRTLFNQPESILLVRARDDGDERYWEEVLDYSLAGNIQAVMDEYVHVLREALGVADAPLDQAVSRIADEIASAVSLRTVSLDYDEVCETEGKFALVPHSFRCRFALPYGDGKGEEDEEETRADQVRSAFNSPFRPFILASTSLGQEGLDFHQYCHSIFHWNLPSNPVDLEQREGRIHRYKGLFIRRNVADRHTLTALAAQMKHLADPWRILFEVAKAGRAADKNDLVPFWIYEGPSSINRFVPLLPLSRDIDQLGRLKATLAVYRMVFGMPRQDDLAAYLTARLGSAFDLEELLKFRIDLSPGVA